MKRSPSSPCAPSHAQWVVFRPAVFRTLFYLPRLLCYACVSPFGASLRRLALRLPAAPAMVGRTSHQELVARAKAKGYQRGVHREKDEIWGRHKHVDNNIKDHEAVLDRYVM